VAEDAAIGATYGLTWGARVAYELATLDEVKGYMGLNVKDDDVLLTRLLGVASSWIRRFIDHDIFPVQSYTDPITGSGKGDTIWLVEWPVASITSLAYEDGRTIPQRIAGSDGWWLELPNIVHLHGYRIARGEHAFCTYTAGWPEIPPEITQACVDIVTYEYKRRARIAQNSKNLPSETVTFDTKWASEYGRTVLAHWQRVAPRVGGLT
jgi:hypothetical protein